MASHAPTMAVRLASQSTMLLRVDANGRKLYRMTGSGNIVRTSKISKRVRRQVLERDGHCCVWCRSPDELELDHVVPYVDGGPSTFENLRTLCHAHHVTRGDR